MDETKLAQRLADGVATTEGVHSANLIKVSYSDGTAVTVCTNNNNDGDNDTAVGLTARTMLTEDGAINDGPRFNVDYTGPYLDVRLVVKEGKYHMVRRMMVNCGHPVVKLGRLRHGKVKLGNLKVGEFRHTTVDKIKWAKSLIL